RDLGGIYGGWRFHDIYHFAHLLLMGQDHILYIACGFHLHRGEKNCIEGFLFDAQLIRSRRKAGELALSGEIGLTAKRLAVPWYLQKYMRRGDCDTVLIGHSNYQIVLGSGGAMGLWIDLAGGGRVKRRG